MTGKISLETNVALNIEARRHVEAMETLALVNDVIQFRFGIIDTGINTVVRITALEFHLVIVRLRKRHRCAGNGQNC